MGHTASSGRPRERFEVEQHLTELDRVGVLDVDQRTTASNSSFTSFISFIASKM